MELVTTSTDVFRVRLQEEVASGLLGRNDNAAFSSKSQYSSLPDALMGDFHVLKTLQVRGLWNSLAFLTQPAPLEHGPPFIG